MATKSRSGNMRGEMTWRLIIFAVVSLGLLYVSRASLSAPHSHGFYRFFAWEAILALILLNISNWFEDPFSLHQIISWLLLAFSIILVVNGARLLSKIGKP